ncbi:MAG: hypothetical protein ACREL3_11330 [Gemmatimonadales bacterium]
MALAPVAAAGQSPAWVRVGANAVFAYEASDVIPGGGSLGEVRVVEPTLMVHAGAGRHLRLVSTLNLEGATIPDGELALGNWGEGFVDRRHPHTYAHELILSADDLLGARDRESRVSVSVGKGFVPFGTDDPMVRPFLRFPVNHHLSQILERAVAIAGVRTRYLAGELGLFNGDEPERPGQWPRIGGRFGDSWAARLTTYPASGVELQASHANVHSPEHRPGAGTDQGKWSLSARWSKPVGGHPVYGLVEWSRTSEAGGFFVFHSVLAEGAWTAGRHRLQYRFERTERPEEERLSNFRSLRPHLENSILGITRWTVHTAGYEFPALGTAAVGLRPLVEVSYGAIRKVRGGVIDVQSLYGQDHFVSLSVGVRVGVGMPMHRMGRYGSLEDAGMTHPHHGGMSE